MIAARVSIQINFLSGLIVISSKLIDPSQFSFVQSFSFQSSQPIQSVFNSTYHCAIFSSCFAFSSLISFCKEHENDVEDGDGNHSHHQHAVICSEEACGAQEDNAGDIAHEHEQAFGGSF